MSFPGGPSFAIRYRNMVLRIGPRPLVVGRGDDCDLVLSDGLVSRHHFQISLVEGGVLVEDRSTNGIFMVGRRLGPKTLINGPSTLTVGNLQVDILIGDFDPSRGAPTLHATLPPPAQAPVVHVATRPTEAPDHGLTDRTEMLHLIAPAAERFLAEGKLAEAEDVLSGRLEEALSAGRARGWANPSSAPTAVRCALSLASASGRTKWLDYAFELYGIRPDVLPIEAVDELFRLAHKGVVPRLGLVRDYLSALDGISQKLGPAERFVLQRLRGLEKLIASR